MLVTFFVYTKTHCILCEQKNYYFIIFWEFYFSKYTEQIKIYQFHINNQNQLIVDSVFRKKKKTNNLLAISK